MPDFNKKDTYNNDEFFELDYYLYMNSDGKLISNIWWYKQTIKYKTPLLTDNRNIATKVPKVNQDQKRNFKFSTI